MAKDKKMVEDITSMDVDFAQWYTDIVKKAELIEYTSVKGCMVIRPYGYAIWENIQKILDKMFKDLGHENVCMPMFIPESLLNKEKDHVEGFAPEVAWVRNSFLRALCKHHPFIQRPSQALQPVGKRCKMGKDHTSLPQIKRISLAGRSYRSRYG